MPSSRIDFTASHLIAIGALALYLTQTLLKIQLANQGDLLPSCLGGFLIITGSYACWRKLRHSDKDIKDPKYNKDNFSWKKIGLLMLLGVAFVLTGGNALASIAGVLIGIGIVAVSEIYLGRLVAGSR